MALKLLSLGRRAVIEPIFEILSRLSSLRGPDTLPRRRARPVVREELTLRILILSVFDRIALL